MTHITFSLLTLVSLLMVWRTVQTDDHFGTVVATFMFMAAINVWWVVT